ncbi:MAG: hypothetical protein KJ709_07355, partial [Nanoarchaeota archaeon]|nr:hypothetical protein [Nanoarchaeota archaeon]
MSLEGKLGIRNPLIYSVLVPALGLTFGGCSKETATTPPPPDDSVIAQNAVRVYKDGLAVAYQENNQNIQRLFEDWDYAGFSIIRRENDPELIMIDVEDPVNGGVHTLLYAGKDYERISWILEKDLHITIGIDSEGYPIPLPDGSKRFDGNRIGETGDAPLDDAQKAPDIMMHGNPNNFIL